jgi:hypothetical protein
MSMAGNNDRGSRREKGLSSLPASAADERAGVETGDAALPPPIVEAAWDPYQVWLTRVKQPREESVQRRSPPPQASDHVPVVVDLSETARLRALSAALPG